MVNINSGRDRTVESDPQSKESAWIMFSVLTSMSFSSPPLDLNPTCSLYRYTTHRHTGVYVCKCAHTCAHAHLDDVFLSLEICPLFIRVQTQGSGHTYLWGFCIITGFIAVTPYASETFVLSGLWEGTHQTELRRATGERVGGHLPLPSMCPHPLMKHMWGT